VRSLENINLDLEYRLEQQAKMTFYAEQRYTDIDNAWKQKYVDLQKVHEYGLYYCDMGHMSIGYVRLEREA
jgi:hypothetical protein